MMAQHLLFQGTRIVSKLRFTASALMLGSLVACSGGGGSTGPGGNTGVESPRSVVIPPGGGTVQSLDGQARVVVPAGALAATTTLEVERLRSDEIPAVVAAKAPIARVWRFGPERLQFATDVEVTIGFDTNELPSGVDLSRLTLVTVGLDGNLETLRDARVVGASAPDGALAPAAGSSIRGLISHFSPFAIVAFPKAAGTFRGDSDEGLIVCTPPLPAWEEDPDPELVDFVVFQNGDRLSATVGGSTFTGRIELDGTFTLAGITGGTSPEFDSSGNIELIGQLILPSGSRITGTFTITETVEDLANRTTHICRSVGTLDLPRVSN